MTAQTFTAFGVQRTSERDRSWASRDQHGAVRFHASETSARAAAGRFGHVERCVVTASRKRTAKVCRACNGTGVHRVDMVGHRMHGQDVACFTCCGTGK